LIVIASAVDELLPICHCQCMCIRYALYRYSALCSIDSGMHVIYSTHLPPSPTPFNHALLNCYLALSLFFFGEHSCTVMHRFGNRRQAWPWVDLTAYSLPLCIVHTWQLHGAI
jgi:hypothetical protein